ncbi:MAG TPA: sodium-dependent transporter [Longimicrobiales bacterium]|nr:sodium-dependent transporter [Longimicrobiales bacterium]
MSAGTFTTRWGMMLAMLGMAVGTGNIWRFPRVAATNGGGSFLVAWVTFLLLWSIPLILVEFAMGRATRYGPVGAFAKLVGEKFAWMGAWVAFTATAIMFYYTVVMAWTIRYFWAALSGELSGAEPGALWDAVSYQPPILFYHALAMGLAAFVVAKGVRGIETAARILIPSLFVLVLALAVRAVTLPGAERGLEFLFHFDGAQLLNYRIWLEALTQNAWDTGAGWGLILTYAIYMRSREDTALNAFLLGFGNNSMSLLAGIVVLCTVFAIMPDAADQIVGAGNEGLTFIWVPQLFALMPLGRLFMVLFFLALVFAAWTSLISMIELATRVLVDLGLTRGRAIAMVAGFGFLFGIPSALSQAAFLNQDFVWGVGLMVSGLFFAIAVLKYGVTSFRETFINGEHADIRIGAWWDWAIRLVVVEAAVLIVWWFLQVRGEPLFGTFGIGNVLVQWALALAVFVAATRWLARRTLAAGPRSDAPEGHMPASIP